MYKKCMFQKMSSKGRNINNTKKGKKAMTSNERARVLADWKKGWM